MIRREAHQQRPGRRRAIVFPSFHPRMQQGFVLLIKICTFILVVLSSCCLLCPPPTTRAFVLGGGRACYRRRSGSVGGARQLLLRSPDDRRRGGINLWQRSFDARSKLKKLRNGDGDGIWAGDEDGRLPGEHPLLANVGAQHCGQFPSTVQYVTPSMQYSILL